MYWALFYGFQVQTSLIYIYIYIRYYYCNCRFNARSFFERALVLLDDNVVK